MLINLPRAFAQEDDLLPANEFAVRSMGELVPAFVRVAIMFAGIATLFAIIWGGFKFILSGGDEEKRQNAKNTIIAGIIGFGFIILTPMILTFLTTFFGIPLTIPDFTNLVR